MSPLRTIGDVPQQSNNPLMQITNRFQRDQPTAVEFLIMVRHHYDATSGQMCVSPNPSQSRQAGAIQLVCGRQLQSLLEADDHMHATFDDDHNTDMLAVIRTYRLDLAIDIVSSVSPNTRHLEYSTQVSNYL